MMGVEQDQIASQSPVDLSTFAVLENTEHGDEAQQAHNLPDSAMLASLPVHSKHCLCAPQTNKVRPISS